jgi:hypothetical protein
MSDTLERLSVVRSAEAAIPSPGEEHHDRQRRDHHASRHQQDRVRLGEGNLACLDQTRTLLIRKFTADDVGIADRAASLFGQSL